MNPRHWAVWLCAQPAVWLVALTLVVLVLWRVVSPGSFWVLVQYPFASWRLRRKWAETADACGLAGRKNRLLSRDGQTRLIVPKINRMRPSRYGIRLRLRLRSGQTPEQVADKFEHLRHSWGAIGVRVRAEGPGWVDLIILRRDPLARVELPRRSRPAFLAPAVGRTETADLFGLNFRLIPHWLIMGATQSGKSSLLNALICALAPQPVALIGFDLKGGVEFTGYRPRMTRLATTRTECNEAITRLLTLIEVREQLCTAHGARSIWELPASLIPTPVVVLVDEVAELFLMGSKEEKAEVAQVGSGLLRVAQLARAFGIYLIVCGQRIGSDLGPGVTALRSQLSGRICFKVNSSEDAKMVLDGVGEDAIEAAKRIPADTPGVCITANTSGAWSRARSVLVNGADADAAAERYAHLTPSWDSLVTIPTLGEHTPGGAPAWQPGIQGGA